MMLATPTPSSPADRIRTAVFSTISDRVFSLWSDA